MDIVMAVGITAAVIALFVRIGVLIREYKEKKANTTDEK